ncbi:uncharacterized protein [Antedon mediterranea]|uniref:uncharacterized protein n=1 Tax=Antedon mediterranea TaxID=105859 RepID=UPI003AF51453
MNKNVSKYLRGFYSSFERSFNKRVLSDDSEIEEAYKTAQQQGMLPFNRTKILILGDHAAGKTSTCRRLQGKEFRQNEPSTIGIETDSVKAKVTDVNSKWCAVTNTPLEDYECSAAWWAVSHVSKRSKNESRSSTITKPNEKTKSLIRQTVDDFTYLVIHNFPIMITFLVGGFTFGFGFISWICILCLMYIFDAHSAYRFGSAYTIAMVLVDSAMNTGLTEVNSEAHGIYWTDTIHDTMTVCAYGVIGLITGALMGAGGRTGICIAFSIMVHPRQQMFTIANVTKTFIIIYSRAYFKLSIYIFAITTIIINKNVHFRLYTLSRKNCIMLLAIIVMFLNVLFFIGRQYFTSIFVSSCVAVTVFCTANGIIVGRNFVAYGYIPQNYIFKKSVGFIAGLFIAYFCDWQLVCFQSENTDRSISLYFINLLFIILPIISFIIYEWFAYMKVKHTTSIPITHVRQSLKAVIRNECYLDARLSLWDFAGQEMYYNTHNLFMPKQGVYLIVFNAVKAVLNPGKQIKRLEYWLQSVAMHAEIKNVVVLLVGTRRDDTKDNNALETFLTLATIHLYKRFSKLLAFHPSGKLFFFLENALNIDKERNVLRDVIYSEIRKLDFFQQKFSIKHLLFNQTLSKLRQKKRLIVSLEEMSENEKSIWTTNELRQLLIFFDRSGEIIYKDHDELLRKYVICDPQLLVDFLKFLVNIPEPHKRNREVADCWQKLQEEGIVDSRLLQHICQLQGIWAMYPYVISFLVGTHLLFPLNVSNEVEPTGSYFLGCRLPKIACTSTIWNNEDESQTVFYFDFREILTEILFLRIVAKCCEEFTWDKVYYNAARIRASKSCLFMIMTDTISGKIEPCQRNLIKLAIHNDDQSQTMHVLQTIINITEEIVNIAFDPDHFRENYIYGPRCNTCSSLGDNLSLVNLVSPGYYVSSLDGYRPDHYHKISLNPKFSFTCSRIDQKL